MLFYAFSAKRDLSCSQLYSSMEERNRQLRKRTEELFEAEKWNAFICLTALNEYGVRGIYAVKSGSMQADLLLHYLEPLGCSAGYQQREITTKNFCDQLAVSESCGFIKSASEVGEDLELDILREFSNTCAVRFSECVLPDYDSVDRVVMQAAALCRREPEPLYLIIADRAGQRQRLAQQLAFALRKKGLSGSKRIRHILDTRTAGAHEAQIKRMYAHSETGTITLELTENRDAAEDWPECLRALVESRLGMLRQYKNRVTSLLLCDTAHAPLVKKVLEESGESVMDIYAVPPEAERLLQTKNELSSCLEDLCKRTQIHPWTISFSMVNLEKCLAEPEVVLNLLPDPRRAREIAALLQGETVSTMEDLVAFIRKAAGVPEYVVEEYLIDELAETIVRLLWFMQYYPKEYYEMRYWESRSGECRKKAKEDKGEE